MKSICRKSNDTSEFGNLFVGTEPFSVQTTKGSALYFSTEESAVGLVLKV